MILVVDSDASLVGVLDERCVHVESRAALPERIPGGTLLLLAPDAVDDPDELVRAARERADGSLAVVAVSETAEAVDTAAYDGVLAPDADGATVRRVADRARRIAAYREAVATLYETSPGEGTAAARERAAERFAALPDDLDDADVAAIIRPS
ncbi:hypothetical protein J2752_002028 [Halarchaeum rubridurum]|uniref:HalX domain-containing protein n=1 Tax=Halarchaeum rubridurum TaxID=489911 RepID=A0A830G098_9EURY|nr:hypothetical protein [Halarchaeum rubridurum]MBP1955116.1 hypothetical protein [Halarchaeum rubridurum]GGM68817.1 hypothetical protein GCM10009017_18780 [Halarchaeum rubridurum]